MADLPLSRLTKDETNVVAALERKIRKEDKGLLLLEHYRDAEQRIEHIGLAVPPELRRFEASINVPGMAVREVVNRQAIRAFVRRGKGGETPDDSLRDAWEYNNLSSASILCHKEARTYGRAFVAVGTNPEIGEPPVISVEGTRGMAVSVNKRVRRISEALRVYKEDDGTRRATLYLPDATIYLVRQSSAWLIDDRDDHNFGKVPLIMFLNDPSAGQFAGRSIMSDVNRKVDAITRTLTNMQIAAEIAAIPQNVIFGATENDFVDRDGNPIPTWEAYWTKLKAISDPAGKIGKLEPGDLKQFTAMVDRFLVWCAIELGLPTRYAGLDTTNPASEGAVVADEFRLVKRVENINLVDGDAWAWVMSLHEEFRTGEAPQRNSIRVLWHDPSTPTYSQRVDGVIKLRSSGLLSRQGAWDEMGWGVERKNRELEYLASESDDPLMAAVNDLMSIGNGGQPAASRA